MKYVAAVVLALGLLVLGWGAYSVVRPALQQQAQGAAARVEDKTAIDKLLQEKAEAGRVHASLSGLQVLMQPAAAEQSLIAQAPPVKKVVKSPFPDRALSMVYYGEDYQRAVIDGLMVGAGDALPSGGKLMEVRADRVVIKERAGVRSILVPSDKLRMGNVHHNKATGS